MLTFFLLLHAVAHHSQDTADHLWKLCTAVFGGRGHVLGAEEPAVWPGHSEQSRAGRQRREDSHANQGTIAHFSKLMGALKNTAISQDGYKMWLENTRAVNAAPLTKLRFWAESPMRRCCRVACSWLLVLEDCSTQASEAAVWLSDTEASHPWSTPRTTTTDGSGRRRWLLVTGSIQMLQLWETCSNFVESKAQINDSSRMNVKWHQNKPLRV